MTDTMTDTDTFGATALANAAAGAAWLDSHDPGWAARMDVDSLDLVYNDACILGQLYGDFWDALDDKIPDAALDGEDRLDTATRLGFYASCPDGNEVAYAGLTSAWLIEIGNRRG